MLYNKKEPKENHLNKIIAGIIALTSLTIPEAMASGSDYIELLETVEATGVRVAINPDECFSKFNDFDGYYHSSESRLVVCQDNARGPEIVNFTENDLDTIRHEVHHLIQDCKSGVIGDSQLGLYFNSEEDYIEFIAGALTERQIDNIGDAYSDRGPQVRLQELEAFAVANTVSPDNITKAIRNFCF